MYILGCPDIEELKAQLISITQEIIDLRDSGKVTYGKISKLRSKLQLVMVYVLLAENQTDEYGKPCIEKKEVDKIIKAGQMGLGELDRMQDKHDRGEI